MQGKVRMMAGILSLLTAVFTGCGRADIHKNDVPYPEKEAVSVNLPEQTSLTGFFMHHEGMAMEPYYILKECEDGIYVKITDTSPEDFLMYEGEEKKMPEDGSRFLAFADTVKECENASLVRLDNEEILRQLEDAAEETGALGWDGYDKKVSGKGASDTGDRYMLYLELSDGTSVEMHGYNACPAGYESLLESVREIFHIYAAVDKGD